MDVRIQEDLWATAMMQEGVLERWRIEDGSPVGQGQAVAEVRIEDCLHEIIASEAGHLVQLASAGSVIEPGALIGQISA